MGTQDRTQFQLIRNGGCQHPGQGTGAGSPPDDAVVAAVVVESPVGAADRSQAATVAVTDCAIDGDSPVPITEVAVAEVLVVEVPGAEVPIGAATGVIAGPWNSQ